MKRIFTLMLALLLAPAFHQAHAADWSKPALTDTYTNVLTFIKDRDVDAARQFSSAYTAATNVSAGTIRWNDTSKKWELWSGTAWGDLATGYAISITGNAATATALQTARTINGVSFNGSANISVNTVNALTFDNSGTGAASGSTFNGGAAQTISYNTIGALSVTGTAATATAAVTATTATHLAGGSAGTVPYQSAAGTTAQLAAGTSGYYLRANGAAAPAWEAPATVFGNIKVAASETATGVVELATTAEATAGTDTTRAVTPAGVAAALAATTSRVSFEDRTLSAATSEEFTLPASVKEVEFTLYAVGTNGSTDLRLQFYVSGAWVTTGYLSYASGGNGGVATNSATNGFRPQHATLTSAARLTGGVQLTRAGTANKWVATGQLFDAAGASQFIVLAGYIDLAADVTKVRFIDNGGTNVLNTGVIRAKYSK